MRERLGRVLGPDPAEAVAFLLLLLVIVLAPIPYGSVLPAGVATLEGLAFLSAGTAFLSRRAAPRLGLAWIPLLSISGLVLLCAFQLLPLPPAILDNVSPASAAVYREVDGVLRLFHHPARWSARISIAPSETLDILLLTLAFMAAFAAAAHLLHSRARRRVFVGVLLASGVAHTLVAALTASAGERLRGPFVNPNHFAGYLQIPLAFAFAIGVYALSSREDGRAGPWRVSAELERRLARVSGAILLWGALAVGIGLTGSRGGLVAAVLATLLMAILSVLRGEGTSRRRERALAAASALFAGVLFVGLVAGREPLLRLLASDPRELGRDARLRIWGLSLDAHRLFPVFGSGLGTFREAFRRVQPRDFPGLVEQAHSEPLQLLVTGGVTGLVLGAAGLASSLWLLLRLWRRQRHREERALALGALGALVSLLVHGLWEFNFSLPAIPATLAAVIGAGWAAGTWTEAAPRPAGEVEPGAGPPGA